MRHTPSRHRAVHRLALALLQASTLALPLAGLSPPAVAQAPAAETRLYTIPGGPLDAALNRFAREAGVALSFNAQDVQGRTTPGLNGSYGVVQGFAALLAGSGFVAEQTAAGYVLRVVAAGTGVVVLDPLSVEGQAGSASVIGNLPPAYAGGQVARGGDVGILGNRDFMDTPFNQTNYTAELVQNQQAPFLADILANDPSARALGTALAADSMNVRGFFLSNTSGTLFNGLQAVNPGGGTVTFVEGLERIEVLKGPNALVSGVVGNAAGLVNLVPKRAGNEPLTRFTPSYSSDAQFGGHVDIGRRFGNNHQFGVRFNGVYRNGDGAIDHLSRKMGLAAFGLDYRGERLRLELDLNYQKDDLRGLRRFTLLAAGLALPSAPDSSNNWFSAAEFNDTDVYHGSLRGEFDLTERLTAYVAAGARETRAESLLFNRTIINAQGDLAAGSYSGDADTFGGNAWTVETGLRAEFTTGPVQHRTTIGYSKADSESRRALLSGAPITPFQVSNIYNPVFGTTPRPVVTSYGEATRRSRSEIDSTVLVDTLSILDEQVQLTVGVRFQQVKATNFNATSGAVTSIYDKDATTPMVGLVVKPWQNVSLYANYIEGLQQGQTAPITAANAGQVFPPYVMKQHEIGAKIDTGQFGGTLSLYQITQPGAFIDVATNIFGVNGEQRHRGVELNLFGELTPGVRLLGGLAYTDSELTKTQGGLNDGNTGAAVPKWRAVLVAEWDPHFVPGFTLTGRAARTGSLFLDPANRQTVPAWTRIDIGARYRVNETVTVRANINNLFDNEYWDVVSANALALSEPRTFTLSATIDF